MRFGVPHKPIPVVAHVEAVEAKAAQDDAEKEQARRRLDDLKGRFSEIIDDFEKADEVMDRRRRGQRP